MWYNISKGKNTMFLYYTFQSFCYSLALVVMLCCLPPALHDVEIERMHKAANSLYVFEGTPCLKKAGHLFHTMQANYDVTLECGKFNKASKDFHAWVEYRKDGIIYIIDPSTTRPLIWPKKFYNQVGCYLDINERGEPILSDEKI